MADRVLKHKWFYNDDDGIESFSEFSRGREGSIQSVQFIPSERYIVVWYWSEP